MTVLIRNGALLTRRRFLATAASSAALMATGSFAKPFTTSEYRMLKSLSLRERRWSFPPVLNAMAL